MRYTVSQGVILFSDVAAAEISWMSMLNALKMIADILCDGKMCSTDSQQICHWY
jgi:hypothetical protein